MTRSRTWLLGRRTRGQTLLEFALILPVFLLVLVGLFDVGRAVFVYNTLSNAAREGLREAIVHQDEDAVRAEAEKALIGTPATITLTPCATFGCLYGIEIMYDFVPATPLIGDVFNPTITASAEMSVETLNP